MKYTLETTHRLVELNAIRRDLRRNIKCLAGAARTDMAAELAALENDIEKLVGVPQPRTSLPAPTGWAKIVADLNARHAR